MASPGACAWLAVYQADGTQYRPLGKLLSSFKVRFEDTWRMRNAALQTWRRANIQAPESAQTSPLLLRTGAPGTPLSVAESEHTGPADSSIGLTRRSPSLRSARAAPYKRHRTSPILEADREPMAPPLDIVVLVQWDMEEATHPLPKKTLAEYGFVSPKKKGTVFPYTTGETPKKKGKKRQAPPDVIIIED